MKTRTETVVDVSDWDDLVSKSYGRRYSFQQQDGCRTRGTFKFKVPDETDDYEGGTVSFDKWLKRDPKEAVGGRVDYSLILWWDRDFYPDVQMVANDLHSKGLLEAGQYTIDIDW